jgi:hypothetical protein
MSLETVEWRVEPAIAQGGETDDPHVDAYRRPRAIGGSTSRTAGMDTNHFLPELLTVTFLVRPKTLRLLR